MDLPLKIAIALWLTFIIVVLLDILIKKRYIYRGGELYLIRWTIIKTPWFSLKVHKALLSDPADHHDHPWNYVSFIIKGGYTEETPIKYVNPEHERIAVSIGYMAYDKKFYKPGSLLFRDASKPHRLIISPNRPCTSLILTTRKFRDWGFVKDHEWHSHKEISY
jgi:hypothetical protein